MIKFEPSEYLKQRPGIQMTSMIHIMFINLLFFMALFVYFRYESELSISVPTAKTSADFKRPPGEIVINISKDGTIFVNQKQRTLYELHALLKETVAIYPNQEVIIRGDEKAYHEYIIRVLDVCADAKISNISFATVREK